MRRNLATFALAMALAANSAMADSGWHPAMFGVSPTVSLAPKLERLPAPDLAALAPDAAHAVPAEGLTEAWLLEQHAPEGDAEWQCLTEALYFEARGESLDGQIAVAEVILNRADSPLYPRTVCGVVKQRGSGGCQFSYVCSGKKKLREKGAADLAGRIARAMLDGAPRLLTEGATHFHTRGVKPSWSKRFSRTASIGSHLCYRQPGTEG